MNPIQCLECERRKNQLFAQLDELRKKVKTIAIENDTTYTIYLDTEDQKLVYKPAKDQCSYDVIEYVSKYT